MRTLVVLALVAGVSGAQDFAEKVAWGVDMAKPLRTEQVILIPLVMAEEPEAPGVVPSVLGKDASAAEPAKPAKKHDVLIHNKESKPLFVPGGSVLEGGLRDRLIRWDCLVAPGGAAEVRALPASATSDIRKEAAPFRLDDTMAPLYLCRKASLNATDSLVPTFVTRWLDFRDEGDNRRSLTAINDSKTLAEFSLKSREAGTFPKALDERHVLGGIAAIRGRIQSLTLYGSNDLLQAYWDPLVRGATFAAAATELRAKAAGVKVPGKGDWEKTEEIVTKAAKELLGRLRKAKYTKVKSPAGDVGESFTIRLSDGTTGRAIGYQGRLVHLVLYPRDPVSDRLYAAAVDPSKRKTETDDDDVAGSDDDLSDEESEFCRRMGRSGGRRR